MTARQVIVTAGVIAGGAMLAAVVAVTSGRPPDEKPRVSGYTTAGLPQPYRRTSQPPEESRLASPLPDMPSTEASEDSAALVLAYLRSDIDDDTLVAELPTLVDRWAEASPQAAAAWVESLPDGLARDLAAATVANRQARTNPMLAAVWLKGFPGIEDMLRE